MRIFTATDEIRHYLAAAREVGKTVGLVATLGALHAGHAALIRRSVADNDVTVVSIFVNPTQFGPNEDFENYPRRLDQDARVCEKERVDAIFAPQVAGMYPADFSTFVEETALSAGLCGASRPTHFRGVATVVAKLFNIIAPDRAYFGRKDAQQAAVVNRMVRDLDFPVEIVLMPIVRDPDGLAMSSRNKYLVGELRDDALVLRRALTAAEDAFNAGGHNVAALKDVVRETVAGVRSARLDYVDIVDAVSFKPVAVITSPALLAIAVFIGKTRLIDNTILSP